MRARLLSVAGLFRVDLPRPVLVLQFAGAVNAFGFGLILPFEIIYLNRIRGFPVTTAGLVLSTVMGTAVLVGPLVGTLLDHVKPKVVLVVSAVVSGAGYAGLAFVEHPWQAFLCSVAAGIGQGAGQSAGPTLSMSFLSAEQRRGAFALSRVAANVGIGSGALVAGLIVGAGDRLHSFQLLYLFDAITFAAAALVLLVAVPNVAVVHDEAEPEGAARAGYRAVARDRVFVSVMAANVVLVVVGYSLFANLLPPFVRAETAIGPRAIGALFLVNTAFIVIVQVPAVRVIERLRRGQALALMAAFWAVACFLVLPAATARVSTGVALLVGVSILFGIGECLHAIALGPLVVEMAPARLMARYLSVFSLTFTAGLALGPTVGAAVFAASPNALWFAGGATAAVIGAGFLVFGRGLEPALIEAEVVPLASLR